MKLFYYHDPAGNFGDELNCWLWPRVAPGLLAMGDSGSGGGDDNSIFVGIGSILDQRIPDGPEKIVFGTGIGYGRLPAVDSRWKIYCVRGPLTARALGLPPSAAVTDAAALVATVFRREQTEREKVSFIPHFRSPVRAAQQGVDLRQVVESAGIEYVDPCAEVETVLEHIKCSEMVLAEAMHGAIVADALGVPWVGVRLYDHICDLKWQDWCGSLGLEYTPVIFIANHGMSIAEDLERFIKGVLEGGRPILSNRNRLEAAIAELQERLHCIRMGGSASDAKFIRGGEHLVADPEVVKGIPWLYEIQSAIAEVARIVPPGSRFLLVDEQRWGGGQVLAGRHCIPFLERQSEYWGLPPDDETAIAELERLREEGAEFVVFAHTSFWWLDYYQAMNSHLRTHYRPVYKSARVAVFDLRE